MRNYCGIRSWTGTFNVECAGEPLLRVLRRLQFETDAKRRILPVWSKSWPRKAGISGHPVWIPNCLSGGMDRNLKLRTKALALDVITLARELPRDSMTELLTVQLVRAGTSAGANYRAACRAKSRADFIAKMTTTEEEMDETSFWLEVLVESGAVSRDRARPLLDEANQLTAIVVSSARTAKANRR